MFENSEDTLKYELEFDQFIKEYDNIKSNSDDVLLLDFRAEDEIYNGFIPKTISCDKGYFPRFVPKESKLLLVIPAYYEEEIIGFLKDNGYLNIIGYLKGGIDSWVKNKKALTLFPESSNPHYVDSIIDCREPREWNYGVVDCKSIKYIQLGNIPNKWNTLQKNITYGVLCKRGGRSLAATTYLMSKGIKVVNLSGGMRNLICGGFKLMKKI